MSEKEKAARFNITLPPELRARMEAAEGVNWSAVAAEAFSRKLLEIESKRLEAGQMDDVIARLRAAQEADTNDDQKAGREAGENWAKKRARPKQLRWLQKAVERANGVAEWLVEDGDAREGPCPPVTLWTALHVGDEFDVTVVNGFWELVLGSDSERIEEFDFAVGFVDGALDLWEKVESQL